MSKKHKKVCTTLNCIEHFLTLGCTITRCVFVSAFASLVGIPRGIMISAFVYDWIKNLYNNCSV